MADLTERYAVVDRSKAPIIHVRVVGPLTDAGFRTYLAELTDAFASLDEFAVVLEQGHLHRFSSRYLAQSRLWLAENERRFRQRWVSTAFVLSSPVLRGAVSALFWTVRFEFELTVTSSLDEAWRWSEVQLAEHGLDPRCA